MAYYQEKPVNFNDDLSTNHGYDNGRRSVDASTVLTGYTSGITMSHADHFVNQNGETQAQALVSEYRSLSPPSTGRMPTPSTQSPLNRNASTAEKRHDAPLVSNAALPAGSGTGERGFQDLEYQDPYGNREAQPPKKGIAKFIDDRRYPIEQRIEDKKRGIGRQRHPFVVYLLTTVMLAVMIWELVKNAQEQGSPVSTKPFVNPMLGPSQQALINLGARFPPCMKLVDAAPPTLQLQCLNNTDNPPTRLCPLETLCGFGGFHGKEPNQWFRFITPIFLHAGIIHIALNLLAQWILSAQVEREMGSGGFFVLYFAAGIFGNVLGGNFALVGAPSVGASGAIFGTVGVLWVDLLAHWKLKYKPVRQLIVLIIELIIGVALGYIPGVDNFAHIGGFLMGLLTAIIFYPVISQTKRHKLIVWIFRLAAIPLAIVLFVVLIRNFYTGDPYAACSWCRYLSCIPTASNNRCQGTGIVTTTVTTP